jgi:hypothetical protein
MTRSGFSQVRGLSKETYAPSGDKRDAKPASERLYGAKEYAGNSKQQTGDIKV